MNLEDYKLIMSKQFELLKGMYLSKCYEKDGFAFFKSDTINDNFWNFTANITYQDFQKIGFLNNMEQTFKYENRTPCIYIPSFIENIELIKEYLISNGYQTKDHDAFMFFNGWNMKNNIENEIREVRNMEDLEAYIDVLNNAFGGEPTEENPYGGAVDESYEKALEESLHDSEKKFHHIILFEGSSPVSIATLSYKDGYGGLNNVGTKKECQNKGYGKQIMKACVDKFNELGGGKLFLFTEKDSKNELWYKKLGFETKFINEQYVKARG